MARKAIPAKDRKVQYEQWLEAKGRQKERPLPWQPRYRKTAAVNDENSSASANTEENSKLPSGDGEKKNSNELNTSFTIEESKDDVKRCSMPRQRKPRFALNELASLTTDLECSDAIKSGMTLEQWRAARKRHYAERLRATLSQKKRIPAPLSHQTTNAVDTKPAKAATLPSRIAPNFRKMSPKKLQATDKNKFGQKSKPKASLVSKVTKTFQSLHMKKEAKKVPIKRSSVLPQNVNASVVKESAKPNEADYYCLKPKTPQRKSIAATPQRSISATPQRRSIAATPRCNPNDRKSMSFSYKTPKKLDGAESSANVNSGKPSALQRNASFVLSSTKKLNNSVEENPMGLPDMSTGSSVFFPEQQEDVQSDEKTEEIECRDDANESVSFFVPLNDAGKTPPARGRFTKRSKTIASIRQFSHFDSEEKTSPQKKQKKDNFKTVKFVSPECRSPSFLHFNSAALKSESPEHPPLLKWNWDASPELKMPGSSYRTPPQDEASDEDSTINILDEYLEKLENNSLYAEVSRTLDTLCEKQPEIQQVAKYWLCRCQVALHSGNPAQALNLYNLALEHNAEPVEELRTGLRKLKLNLQQKTPMHDRRSTMTIQSSVNASHLKLYVNTPRKSTADFEMYTATPVRRSTRLSSVKSHKSPTKSDNQKFPQWVDSWDELPKNVKDKVLYKSNPTLKDWTEEDYDFKENDNPTDS